MRIVKKLCLVFSIGMTACTQASDNVLGLIRSSLIASLATTSTTLVATVPLPTICGRAPFTLYEMRNILALNAVTTFLVGAVLHRTSEDSELILAGIGAMAVVLFMYTLYARYHHTNNSKA